MTNTTPTEKARLLALAATGTLTWEHECDMGGEWIRHNIGNGFDAILHEDEDNPSTLLLTISRYRAGEVISTTEVATIMHAETLIGGFYPPGIHDDD